ncbi:hypothetical protein FAIPA1_20269 [Frankia sp. AiPs1]
MLNSPARTRLRRDGDGAHVPGGVATGGAANVAGDGGSEVSGAGDPGGGGGAGSAVPAGTPGCPSTGWGSGGRRDRAGRRREDGYPGPGVEMTMVKR